MKKQKNTIFDKLPRCAIDFISLIVKKMRYRKKVRADVQAELAAHFEDELKDCKTDQEKQQKVRQLIADFGDAKLLAVLLRRAKKRCRPLWRIILVRSFAVLGVTLLYLICVGLYFASGSPNISVNYVDRLNDLVRAGRDETKNARPYYDDAARVCVTIPKEMHEIERAWPGDLNDVEIQVSLQWINDNKQALELVGMGTQKPYCWPTYRSDETELVKAKLLQNVIKPLSDYRSIARALDCRIRDKAYMGEIESALSDCLVMQKFAGHLQGTGLLTEQMVGIAIEALAYRSVFMVLKKADVPANVLKGLQEQLDKVYAGQEPVINLQAEKAFWYDLVQRGFTDDGKGSGRVLKRGLPLVIGDWQDAVWGFVTCSYPDRKEVTNTIDQYFHHAEELFANPPRQLHIKDLESKRLDEIVEDSLMLQILAPAHARLGQLVWRLKTSRAALLTTIAVIRHHKDKARYPENLDELVKTGYLKEIPQDPYSDKNLVYRETEDDFILYSVGLNFTDDGGQVHQDDRGRFWQWADQGDAVFWPVRK